MTETKKFFDEQIAQRWPDWEPTGPQIEDWEKLIRPYRREDVLEAITKLAYEKDWKAPSLPTMRKNLRAYRFARPVFMREIYVQRPDTGEYHKIFLRHTEEISDDVLLEEAMHWAEKHAKLYLGEWIGYTGVTELEMVEKRRLINNAVIDGE